MTCPTPVPHRPPVQPGGSVALVTLGCARNEVDSEELAGRLSQAGFVLVQDPAQADTVLVNTCGFVESAKKDSVDTLLAAADLKQDGRPRAVVAVGCLAERYGAELAGSLPEADAVLGFDDYPDIADRLRRVLAGERPRPHTPRDRRRLLPLAPVERTRHQAREAVSVPGTARGVRRRLEAGPVAPLKLASGCDRRCTFCAIPRFRGSFVSRRPTEVLDEARWLAQEGVRELYLVSENSTSYGKDLGDLRLLESLLPELAAVPGVARVRVSYLQPAETRPGLLEVIAGTPGVASYFDLSFQHASPTVLRRMRRFGDPESFLALLDRVRQLAPEAGVRSNVIVGFPGESETDLDTLCEFLTEARLDVTGVFGYSDEDGTEAAGLDGKVGPAEVAERVARVGDLVEQLVAQRAEDRVGSVVEVLVESVLDESGDGSGLDEPGPVEPGPVEPGPVEPGPVEPGLVGPGLVESGGQAGVRGRAAHQGPDDGATWVSGVSGAAVGDLVVARVTAADGVDLVAVPVGEAAANRIVSHQTQALDPLSSRGSWLTISEGGGA